MHTEESQVLSTEAPRMWPLGSLGFVALLDTSMISPIIASQALLLGADRVLAATIAGSYSLVAIFTTMVAGYLVDKLGRRRLLAFGLLADLFLMLGYAFSVNPIQLFVVRVTHAVADSFVVPSALASIGDLFQRNLGRSLAIYWTFVAVAIIAGSGSASALVLRFGHSGVYLVVAGAITATIGLLRFGGYSLRENGLRGRNPARFAIFTNVVPIAVASAAMLSMYLMVGGVIGTAPSMLIERAGLDERGAAAMVGVFMALSTGTAIPFFFAAERVASRVSPYVGVVIGLVAASASSYLLDTGFGARHLWYLSAVTFGVALSFVFLTSSYISVSLPATIRGTASGISQGMGLLGVVLGSLTSALLAGLHLPVGTFTLIGLPSLATAAVVVAVIVRHRGIRKSENRT
ncbi:MAG: MFS transporter [Thaumarchaeota archaeon]|nr:MFS transporter [Candidatus Calditenuaceae archaeon]MDW8187296.1 MFS transporter [Nitrososphaerota archaeon]